MQKTFSPATRIFLDLFPIRPGTPGLGLLGDVVAEFSHLPWENLTKFLKKSQPPENRLRRGPEVMEDHARLGSGGTCFSLTDTLRTVTEDLGFRVHPALADMRHGPNIHCGLIVVLQDRRYLLDPGYLVPEPVPLEPGKGPHAGRGLDYRPVPGRDAYDLYTVNSRGEETFRYRIRPEAIPEEAFLGHWRESFNSRGMRGLHLNRLTTRGRLSAHDLNLRIDDGHRKQNLKLKEDYAEKVCAHFGLAPELVRQAHEAWERERCRRP